MTSSSPALRIVIAVARTWTRLYTLGLPEEVRDRRRAEIESDLWESWDDATDSSWLALLIAARLIGGIPDDLRWRAACLFPDPRAAGLAIATALGLSILVSILWLGLIGSRALPRPPAAPDFSRPANYPPPPPPPPPCNPKGTSRAPVGPCTPY